MLGNNSMFRIIPYHLMHVVPGLMPGGMELALAQVVTGVSKSGFRNSVVCLKGKPEIADKLPDGVRIYCLNAEPNEVALPFRLSRLIRKTRPDLIHARNWGAWPDIAIGRLLANYRIPFVFSFHGLGRAGYMPFRRRLASSVLVHLTTHLFTVSKQSRELMVKKWGWPLHRTMVIPNGVDTRRFIPKSIGDRESGKYIIGSVGNLRRVKNHALILKSISQLVKNGVDIELRIAGEGNQRDALLCLAKELGLEKRFFLEGRVDNVPRFLHGLDIFVLSSDSEQHPNALNEAMACRIACIATRVGCVEDVLDNGRCGIIVEPGNVGELETAIQKLVNDMNLRNKMAEAGYIQVISKYSLDAMVSRYSNFYESAIRQRKIWH